MKKSVVFTCIYALALLSACASSNKGAVGGHDPIADYAAALNINPDDHEALSLRGDAYAEMGDYDSAIADYSAALRIEPDFYDAMFNRGSAYGNMGDYDRAIADFTAVLRIDPDDAHAKEMLEIALERKNKVKR